MKNELQFWWGCCCFVDLKIGILVLYNSLFYINLIFINIFILYKGLSFIDFVLFQLTIYFIHHLIFLTMFESHQKLKYLKRSMRMWQKRKGLARISLKITLLIIQFIENWFYNVYRKVMTLGRNVWFCNKTWCLFIDS
jgi:hypothetical protein